jgi:two-component system sensor histidine kinase AgrC
MKPIQLVSLVAFILYDIYILLYFKAIFTSKRTHWLSYVAAIAMHIGISSLSFLFLDHRIDIYIMMSTMMLVFYLLFQGHWVEILYAGSIYVFSLYSSRGIVMSIYSLVLHAEIKNVLQNDIYYYSIFLLAVLLSIMVSIFLRKAIIPDDKSKNLFKNRGQLKFVVIYLNFQLLFLLLVNEGRYHDFQQAWYSMLYLGACIISKISLLFVFNHTLKVTELLEYELHTNRLQEQLSRQIRHYQSYGRFTESYRTFRHDYNNMMTSVKTLLRNREYEKAIRMLDNIHDTMQRNVLTHKTYSDHMILDAILQDTANICEEKGIRFSAVAHLPENIMTELDIVRVFTNIMDNAIDACNKLSGPDRFIEIISDANEDWINIEISNSFNGELKMDNDMPVTMKEDKDFHSLGLRIVTEVIENLGGLVFIEPDMAKKIFRTKLCIPKASP